MIISKNSIQIVSRIRSVKDHWIIYKEEVRSFWTDKIKQKRGFYKWEPLDEDTYLGETVPESMVDTHYIKGKQMFEYPGVRIHIIGGDRKDFICKSDEISHSLMNYISKLLDSKQEFLNTNLIDEWLKQRQ